MRRRRRRVEAISVALAVLAGLSLGLLASLVLWPRQPPTVGLDRVGRPYQEDYILMVSTAYARDGDLQRTEERLAYLGAERAEALLRDLAEAAIAQNRPLAVRRSLARLAYEMGVQSPAIMAYVATPAVPIATMPTPTGATPSLTPTIMVTPTRTRWVTRTRTPTFRPPALTVSPSATMTPAPVAGSTAAATATDVPAQAVDYALISRERVTCEGNDRPSAIVIRVQDENGQGMPGVFLKVSWAGGEELFATGLHPDMGPGDADYVMSPGITYTVTLADVPADVAGDLSLSQEMCGEVTRFVSWRIVFQRRR